MVQLEVLSTRGKAICRVDLNGSATVKDLKQAIAEKEPRLTVNRQSVRAQLKGKDVKDSTTLSQLGDDGAGHVYIKDLGPQISWTAVFLAEYAGPLFVYALFAVRPSLIYDSAGYEMSTTAQIAWACWSTHYAKRLLETVFVHRFSHGTMPLRNLFKNCAYYWGFAAYVAYHVNHPLFTPPQFLWLVAGVSLFAISELGNLSVHLLLRNLRPPGTSVRRIPVPDGNPLTALFHYVSCPNYTYEFGAWLGFSILTSAVPSLMFAAAGMFQMSLWALGKHRNYRAEFKDYPKCRKAILPFVL